MITKINLVAAELERMHGRAYAEAFLEDYYRSKIAQLEQQRGGNALVRKPPADAPGRAKGRA